LVPALISSASACGRASLLTAFLAAFGRAIAEVGAIIIVGGNIRGFTRTMTTAIALGTSKGDLPLALGLGLILLALSLAVSTVAFLLAWISTEADLSNLTPARLHILWAFSACSVMRNGALIAFLRGVTWPHVFTFRGISAFVLAK
jgi:hypothetical protein